MHCRPPARQLLLPGLLSILGLLLPSSCGEPEQHGLVIQNPSSERDYFHDFGQVRYGEKVRRTFELKNTDAAPIVIEDLHPSCSCSVPKIEYTAASGEVVRGRRLEEPILTLPPGAVARLEIEVDTKHIRYKNTDKLTMVVLRCDSVNTPFLRFEMHLFVTQAYQATPEEIDLGDIPISGGSSGSSDVITGVPGAQYRLLGVLEASPGLEVNLIEDPRAAETLWRVQVTLSPPLELGPWSGKVLLRSTTDEGTGEGQPLEIGLRGQVVPDVVVYPPVLGFQASGEGAGARAEGLLRALAPGHRIKIVDVQILGQVPGGLRVSYEPERPDANGRSSRWSLVLEAPADLVQELFTGVLRVTLEDGELAPVEVGFVYRSK